ncbi:tRNA (adenosine(37)-N6)-threonylcarbamoyltransferase complex dimerization subunit type 1 TsaB [Tunturibacter empetritectus]|uniref:tRNA threonylcarbamoyladenosine biosynthesis protein TsaB n=1 Tax=Tunturiibacter lichenicola TaxID=2051959 RepID=A0A7W8J529_9BACT|nr:tRNA (adenosine(37)-N6)-threonylcarbamoyltransferase complex dimerization subunit type 1 TsaB [Edaphobacter lichenicola]MBB5342701.1 tRNA threonylcarbamoyladenosine biosynthesis protein TsaB [Edaphobacter lichenicola]
MRFLMIHTAGGEGSVALGDTEMARAIVATEVLPGRSSSELLVPAVRRLMTESDWRPNGLTAVVVVYGPGSFTGVRVGVSAAKGLSEAGAVPLIAVSRLALLAVSVDGGEQRVHAVLDAGRGEFYYGEYVGRRCVREVLMSAQGVMMAASGGLVVACEPKVAEALAELLPKLVDEPLAGDALPFAVERVESGRFEDVATLDANYLRRTDAEIFAKPAAPRAAR